MLTWTSNPSEKNYCMTLELKTAESCSEQGQFKHLTCNYDLDLGCIKRNFLLDTSTYQGEQVCKVILKSIDKCKSGAPDKVNYII